MSLPNINSTSELLPTLKIWQQRLNQVVNAPIPPRSPFNFRATGGAVGATGITLNWESIRGSDGYEIQSSSTGNFDNAAVIANLSSQIATSWFDSTVVSGVKRYYRIRATAGTLNTPHSVKGAWTAPISSTSGSNATTFDGVSHTTGSGGWNNSRNSPIGARLPNTF